MTRPVLSATVAGMGGSARWISLPRNPRAANEATMKIARKIQSRLIFIPSVPQRPRETFSRRLRTLLPPAPIVIDADQVSRTTAAAHRHSRCAYGTAGGCIAPALPPVEELHSTLVGSRRLLHT